METELVAIIDNKMVRCSVNPFDGNIFLTTGEKVAYDGEIYQFTGLTDRKNNKIYRGTILQTGLFQTLAIVVWHKKTAAYKLDFGEAYSEEHRYQTFGSPYCEPENCWVKGHVGIKEQESLCEVA
jgi:hypothetical protein